jgi:hypothetical protein
MAVSSAKGAFSISQLFNNRKKNALRDYVYHMYERHSYLRVSVLLLSFIVVLRYAYLWGRGGERIKNYYFRSTLVSTRSVRVRTGVEVNSLVINQPT